MMKIPAQHNIENPPGQVVNPVPSLVYDPPLVRAIDEYTSDKRQKALQEAFREGERVGYLRGLSERHRALNPSSEGSR